MHQNQSQFGVSADRRRNRLGYHRTSVACGYCRRRKIRCVPEPSDGQARCTNCIRMKKNCVFHPVDQPPTPDTRATQASLSSTNKEEPPVSSSPIASSGKPGIHPFSPISQDMPSAPQSTVNFEAFSPGANAPLASSTNRSFELRGQPNWVSPDTGQNSGSRPGDLSVTWQGFVPASPMSAQFSPFGPGPLSATWPSGGSEPGSRGDISWGNYPPPARSMSYGGEPLNSQPMQYAPVPQSRQFDRRASTLSDVYTPAMGMTVSGMETSAAPELGTPGQAIPPPQFGVWNQPQQPQQHPGYAYAQWGYGENGEPGQQLSNNELPPNPYFDTR
ncbi:hypothetical protein AK830_g2668 [Neonectria ditissima]|uniref:Zn(2)-C6 fungal-type domain-containing protein n=1 Tax=Neonectria ditissima TaxID=78410 RepID=A0A0P7BR47_9HYPO|nr:hypothetical protein AK830_g2668 [Neonectria ditissima]